MAKARVVWEHKLMQNKWYFFVIALVFLSISYGFASWAINSGSLWQYALCIVFLVWAVKEFKRGIHNLRSK